MDAQDIINKYRERRKERLSEWIQERTVKAPDKRADKAYTAGVDKIRQYKRG